MIKLIHDIAYCAALIVGAIGIIAIICKIKDFLGI